MMACFIFVFSVAALGQFAFFGWRAGMLARASQPLSGRIQEAWGYCDNALKTSDFHDLAALHHVCPGLDHSARHIWFLQLYYSAAKQLGRLPGSLIPGASGWANREMMACVRSVAVELDQRLEQLQACAASVRSY